MPSTINFSSLSLRANFYVNASPAGSELAGFAVTNAPWVRELPLSIPLSGINNPELRVSVRDPQGNEPLIDRRFSVVAIGAILVDGF